MQTIFNIEQAEETLTERFLSLVQALSGIRSLTALNTTEMEEAELLDRVLNVLIQNLDLERCSIFLLQDGMLRCAAGKSQEELLMQSEAKKHRHSHAFRIGEGAIGMAAKTGRVYHAKNCRSDDHYMPIIHPDSDKHPGAVICAPIMLGDNLLGVMNVSHPHPDFFHNWQEHVIIILANILAQMLNNFWLMTDMRKEVNKRTKELEHALKETQQLKIEYEKLAIIDDLTQLHNRRYFFTEAPRILSNSKRSNEPFCVILLDLDDFKMINDRYGHDYGDIVLQEVATALKSQTRAGDIIARIGGEEFAFALHDTDVDGALQFAERLRRRIAVLEWDVVDNQNFTITLSIGIAAYNKNNMLDEDVIPTLLNRADIALYQSKNKGRNQVNIFTEA